MIVVTRNGKTRVYEGWRQWLILAGALLLFWIVLAIVAFVVLGTAITLAVTLLLLVPAAALVALAKAAIKRP